MAAGGKERNLAAVATTGRIGMEVLEEPKLSHYSRGGTQNWHHSRS